MKTSVSIAGCNEIGIRVADAAAAQPDMEVCGIFAGDERRASVVEGRGYRLLPDSPPPSHDRHTVVVQCSEKAALDSGRIILAPLVRWGDSAPAFSGLGSRNRWHHHPRIRVATANTIAIARVAAALTRLGPIRRWHSISIMPSRLSRLVDGLDPLEADAPEDRELAMALADVASDISLARVAAPYTHSHLHLTRIEFQGLIARREVRESLESSPRIIVGRAGDGWKSTADLQEFCRDLGRPRGDRPEVFIWEESIEVDGCTLHLMMDVEPDAAPVPELIDAIRLMANPARQPSDSALITDRALRLGAFIKPVTFPNS